MKVGKKPTLSKPVPDKRYGLIDHFPEFTEERGRCRFCPMGYSFAICDKGRITLFLRKDQIVSTIFITKEKSFYSRVTENFQIGLYTCSCQYFSSF